MAGGTAGGGLYGIRDSTRNGGRPEVDDILYNEVIEVMRKHFGDYFEWDGSKSSKMAVLA